jgi:hypothetical protein
MDKIENIEFPKAGDSWGKIVFVVLDKIYLMSDIEKINQRRNKMDKDKLKLLDTTIDLANALLKIQQLEQENERLLNGIRKAINDLENEHNQYLDDVIENLKALEK